MDTLIVLCVLAIAAFGGWFWEIVCHREPAALDARLRHQLQQSADTIRESTLR